MLHIIMHEPQHPQHKTRLILGTSCSVLKIKIKNEFQPNEMTLLSLTKFLIYFLQTGQNEKEKKERKKNGRTVLFLPSDDCAMAKKRT